MSSTQNAIVFKLADHVLQRTTRKVIRDLRAMKDGLQSADDSGLANIWDEVCVQVQGQESSCWGLYVETITCLAETHIEDLKEHELEALWLRTREGRDWLREDESERGDFRPCKTDIAELVFDCVLEKADGWENARIRRYLDAE